MTPILSKKKRLKMALELMPQGVGHYYDLFCDHGLLGQALIEEGAKEVFFNDIKEPLLEQIASKYIVDSKYLLSGSAENLSFEKDAGIFMLGVGGLLIAKILDAWLEKDTINSSHFLLLGPNYYELQLREFLDKKGFDLLKRSFVWESGHGYEFYLVRSNGSSSQWLEFNADFWQRSLMEDEGTIEHLRKKFYSLKKQRDLTEFEGYYLKELNDFLIKCGG